MPSLAYMREMKERSGEGIRAWEFGSFGVFWAAIRDKGEEEYER